jgi:glycosyltransferase involved in cell wall biosynthesis
MRNIYSTGCDAPDGARRAGEATSDRNVGGFAPDVDHRVGGEPGETMIGISLLTLVPGIVGGSETYARELVRALARVGRLDYRVFVPTIARDAADGLGHVVVTAYRARRSLPGRLAAMTLAQVAPASVRRQLDLGRLRVLHFPLTVMLPPVTRPPTVVTILDLQHEIHPEFFSRTELAYRRSVYGRSVRQSGVVIAISRHTAAAVCERYGLDAKRVRVVPLGLDHERFRPPATSQREPFLLYPANRWPHKNHVRLFEAFALLRRERPELRLLLTGTGHRAHSLPPGVEARGQVGADELVRLYQTASVLVFPSLYEGFGQPPLEAMACGCPVASSPAGALPEVLGDAARMFDPRSPESISAAVAELLDRPDHHVARGLERAAGFSWDECARSHDAVYEELAGTA